MSPASRLPPCSVALTVGLVWAVQASSAGAQKLAELWTSARGAGTYKAADRDELREAARLFKLTFAGAEDWASLRNEWKRLRFELLSWNEDGIEAHIVQEQTDHREGRGFYVIRRGAAPALTLQAPHGTDDLHTGKIALLLFREGKVRACACNTLGRKSGDLAHVQASFLQAFTEAAAVSQPRGLIVQIHGFEASRRKAPAAEDMEVVISNGTARPSRDVLEVARSWAKDVTPKVKVYPQETSELGGTTNAQGLLLRDLGQEGFLHVEFSLELRQRLRDDAELRQRLLQGLLKTERVRDVAR